MGKLVFDYFNSVKELTTKRTRVAKMYYTIKILAKFFLPTFFLAIHIEIIQKTIINIIYNAM